MSDRCNHTQDLAELPLTKEQEDLVGKGYAGPPVAIDKAPITDEQVLITATKPGRGNSEMHYLTQETALIVTNADSLDCD